MPTVLDLVLNVHPRAADAPLCVRRGSTAPLSPAPLPAGVTVPVRLWVQIGEPDGPARPLRVDAESIVLQARPSPADPVADPVVVSVPTWTEVAAGGGYYYEANMGLSAPQLLTLLLDTLTDLVMEAEFEEDGGTGWKCQWVQQVRRAVITDETPTALPFVPPYPQTPTDGTLLAGELVGSAVVWVKRTYAEVWAKFLANAALTFPWARVSGTPATFPVAQATASDLGGTRLSGNSTASVSAAGTTTLTLLAAQPHLIATITAGAGAGNYSHNVVLASTNAHGGAFATIHVDLPSSNARIAIRNLSAGGTALGEAVANGFSTRRVTLRCVFDGTNWSLVSRTPTEENFLFSWAAGLRPAGWTANGGGWTLPLGARSRGRAYIVGAGGGAGSGRRGAAGTARWGGGGGGGGGCTEWTFDTRFINSLTPRFDAVTTGIGGVGGGGVTVDDTSGNNGTAGGSSSVVMDISGVGTTVAWANGGNFGSGGTATAGNGAAAATINVGAPGGGGGASSVTGVASNGLVSGNSGLIGGTGGSGGGGISAADVAYAGGGPRPQPFHNQAAFAVPGTFPVSGGGSTASTTTATAAGGNGTFGMGGGGSGASLNGNATGPGGNGGDGFIFLNISY